MTYDGGTAEITKKIGTVWYVPKGSGADTNAGTTPDTAFETIGAAITAMADYDTIVVGGGTYTETGLDIDHAGIEVIFGPGVVIDPASGTALTVSGARCKMTCPDCSIVITPGANETGVVWSGAFGYINDVRVSCGSSADLGFDLTGNGIAAHNIRCNAPLVAAFKIQGDKIKLERCCTGGEAGDSSIGFWMTNTCDKARLKNCGSQGHETAGYQVDTGCTNGVVEECYSGGGDGKWRDADNAFVWSNFSYERLLFKMMTLDGSTAYNLFKVTGAVKVYDLFGHVTTVIANTSADMNLELYSTNGAVDITDSAGAPDIDSDVVGTVYARESTAGDPLEKGEPNATPAVIENTNFRDPQNPIILVKDNGADTYIQCVLSAGPASGAIHWHIIWEPITDDGFVESV